MEWNRPTNNEYKHTTSNATTRIGIHFQNRTNSSHSTISNWFSYTVTIDERFEERQRHHHMKRIVSASISRIARVVPCISYTQTDVCRIVGLNQYHWKDSILSLSGKLLKDLFYVFERTNFVRFEIHSF